MSKKATDPSNKLTIVTYHYVRDVERSRFPQIKARSTIDFRTQIKHIKKHYNVISASDLMNSFLEGKELPPRPLLLTFDDGYAEHFTEVFTVLVSEQLPGLFFPSPKAILEHKVLDVNKIQFILASTSDVGLLVNYICSNIDENRRRFNLLPSPIILKNLSVKSRFDSAETMFCKRALQRELPYELRRVIIDKLFTKHVTIDETLFSSELYMNLDQLRVLKSNGMYIGSHGYDHVWLNTLSYQQQEIEVGKSLEFLASIGENIEHWIMCYPYGAYNESLLEVLKSRCCVAGFTTETKLAKLSKSNSLTLPRLDTNDLPTDSNADADEWTREG